MQIISENFIGSNLFLIFVRMEGLEPPCFAALDPKSSASTSSATSAYHDVQIYYK